MTQNFSIESVKVPIKKELFLCTLGYIVVPEFVKLSRDKIYLRLTCDLINNLIFTKFIVSFQTWVKNVSRPSSKKLFLKGLGYKTSLSRSRDKINLKLGYSHIISLSIPSDRIRLKRRKNLITLKGCNPSQVGNLAGRIRHLKVPDVYKGKGCWYKNETRVLKQLKKK
jgi:ribosomal protein L6P/L9E